MGCVATRVDPARQAGQRLQFEATGDHGSVSVEVALHRR
jgi:hypothetical protein